MYFGLYDTLKPMLLGADAGVGASFILGWAVTITAGLMSYPIGKFSVKKNESFFEREGLTDLACGSIYNNVGKSLSLSAREII